ncbi:hypothetical protein B0H12DRAFT_1036773, partial [Mycena haematopus]
VVAPTCDASTLPVAHGAYGASRETHTERYGSKKDRALTDLLGLGLRLVVWDGKTSRPLVDAQGRILAVLVGQPDDDGYRAAVRRAYDFISSEGCGARFPASMRHHRRGLFAAINIGLTHGKGQLAPTWMDNGVYTPLVAHLLANQDIIHMANFASGTRPLSSSRALLTPMITS